MIHCRVHNCRTDAGEHTETLDVWLPESPRIGQAIVLPGQQAAIPVAEAIWDLSAITVEPRSKVTTGAVLDVYLVAP